MDSYILFITLFTEKYRVVLMYYTADSHEKPILYNRASFGMQNWRFVLVYFCVCVQSQQLHIAEFALLKCVIAATISNTQGSMGVGGLPPPPFPCSFHFDPIAP